MLRVKTNGVQQLGHIHDLDRAIAPTKNVIQATPDSHIGCPMHLDNLGNFLRD